MNPYRPLLERYHQVIDSPNWWEGSLKSLLEEMDHVWSHMGEGQRQEAMQYANELYQKRIT